MNQGPRRGTRGSRRSRGSAIAIAAICAWMLARAPDAQAARPVVAIAPFRGAGAGQAEQAVMRALRKKATVLSSARYAIVAKGVFATGSQAPEDIAAVAREMGARWVVTGSIKAEGIRWSLTVSLRDGQDGQSRAKLRYPLPARRITPGVLRTLAREIADALAAAPTAPRPRKPPPAAEPPAPSSPPAPSAARADDDDDEVPPSRAGESSKRSPRAERAPPPQPKPVAKPAPAPTPAASSEPTPPPQPPAPAPAPEPAPAPAPSLGRPRWARWFELGVGATLTGRSFLIDPPPPRFTSSVVAGLHADLTLYPLAFTWKNAYGFFSGLGLGVTYDKPFWPDSTSRADPTQRFATSEQRIEGGLRWKFTLYRPMPRPQLTIIAEGGVHEFGFAKDLNGDNVVGVPDVRYVYALVGGGLTVHFAEWSWIWAQFVYQAVTDTGPIQAPDQYGLSAAYGLRFTAGLDFLVWKGLRVGASGMYERYTIVFGYDPNNRAKIADGATDEYYGGMLLLGYVL